MHALETKRHDHAQHFTGQNQGAGFFGGGVFEQFGLQGDQGGVGRGLDLLAQALEQVVAPLRQVGNARCQPLGVQAQAEHVDRRREQRGADMRGQQGLRGPVGVGGPVGRTAVDGCAPPVRVGCSVMRIFRML